MLISYTEKRMRWLWLIMVAPVEEFPVSSPYKTPLVLLQGTNGTVGAPVFGEQRWLDRILFPGLSIL
jgi:hypothetical protein